MIKPKSTPRRKFSNSQRNVVRLHLPKDAVVDYKNFTLLQKYVNDRGRIIPRRISGVTAKEQRKLAEAIKHARYLGLLNSGRVKK